MTKDSSFFNRVRTFGQQLQTLLNRTVCDNATVQAVLRPEPGNVALVGTKLDKRLLQSTPVRLLSPAQRSRLWLDVNFNIGLDEDEGRFLTVINSSWVLSLGSDGEDLLLHYDYERGKQPYSESHVQVAAKHEAFEAYLAELGRRKDHLGKIHWPLGGRRFRPCLEDLIECLVVEELVEARPGWQTTLDEHRSDFRRRQIAAVVRRNLDVAVAELKRLDYVISPPSSDAAKAHLQRIRLSSLGGRRKVVQVTTTPGT